MDQPALRQPGCGHDGSKAGGAGKCRGRHPRTEPAGKQRYKDGVLIWKKTTTLAAGSSSAKCPNNQVVTYDGSWLGTVGQKLVTVGAIRVYGSKAAAER